MGNASGPLAKKKSIKSQSPSLGGALVHNLILQALPNEEKDIVLSKMELVKLPTQLVLHESGAIIEYGYFIDSGLVSILNVMSDGKSVEVGITGRDGFVGLPLVVGFDRTPSRAMVQVDGAAFRISGNDVREVLESCPKLEKQLNRYSQEFALQATQLAACNRLHEVGARLARWLLMSQDRVGSSSFHLTQESLASMLGTRRASVTLAAGILQNKRLISYKRGHVKIEKRAELEDAACECYRALNQQIKSWHNGSAS
jgi:CRP-like cAMP-binding protein